MLTKDQADLILRWLNCHFPEVFDDECEHFPGADCIDRLCELAEGLKELANTEQ